MAEAQDKVTRVEAALSCELAMRELAEHEGVVLHAEIAAAIEEKIEATHVGDELAAEGITTVALDEENQLVEHHPDGSTSLLGEI